MITRWNSQNSLVKLSYERVITCRFPAASVLPAATGTTLTRQYKAKQHDVTNSEGETSPDQPAEEAELLPWELTAAEELETFGKPMSGRTARKVRAKITAMYEAGIACTFATFTFVNKVDDQTAVKCLAKMLREWRKDWGQFNYLWVAERQNDNKKYPGNIHFHMVLDRRVDIKKENARWARLQYNSGVVYYAENGQFSYPLDPTYMSNQLISEYVNPFDIDKITSSNGLKMYLAGYVTKSIGDLFKCRVWHCSRGVSELATEIMCGADVHRDLIEQFPGEKNTYVYKKDVYNKKTGKRIRAAGEIIFPVDNCNDFCSWAYIVNVEYCKRYTWLITDLNKAILAGEFKKEFAFTYYSYEEYARNFLAIEDLGYKLYRKINSDWQAGDAKYFGDIKRRSLDFETNFYQYALANKSRGYFSVYTQAPYISRFGQRYYSGILLDEKKFISQLNTYQHAVNN